MTVQKSSKDNSGNKIYIMENGVSKLDSYEYLIIDGYFNMVRSMELNGGDDDE